MEDSTKNRWFWGQWGEGVGQYAYCPVCKDSVSTRTIYEQGTPKSYCKRCGAEVEWKDKENK